MNAILGMSELLSETNLNEEQRKYVTVFSQAGSNLLTLINDILDLSKIESGNWELEKAEFHVRDFIDQTVELVAPKAKIKKLTLDVSVRPEVAPYLTGDPARLRQILINLLGNAVKFTEAGQIVLTVRSVDEGLQFEVADTGIGIPASDLNLVFEDFKQGDASITRKYGGTGLGLGISRRLVERMGGRLSVTSVVGKGSTFRFVVPLEAASNLPDESFARIQDVQDREIEPGSDRTTPGEGPSMDAPKKLLKILVAEDSADNRLLIELYLRNTPYDLQFVANGEEAISAVQAAPFDVVLMDLQMPVVDGLSATRTIREMERQYGRPAVSIVALTANARPEDVTLSLEAGCDAHLSKPISKRRLLALLEQYARSGSECPECTALSPKLAALVPKYLESRNKDARVLAHLHARGDFAAIRDIAHNLKGTGESYGFPQITALGGAMQAAADSSDADAVGRQIRELGKVLAQLAAPPADSWNNTPAAQSPSSKPVHSPLG